MVTPPHHPLHGHQVTVIRVRRGPDPDLSIRFPDGFYGAIAASWTDYAAAGDIAPFPDPPPLLELLGLRQMAQLIVQLRHRHPSNDAGTCAPYGAGYADPGRSCPASP
jgi:hypothetical protein